MRKLVRGGRVVASSGISRADILIEGGRIMGIGDFGDAFHDRDTEIIDADSCIVVPGGIDAHTHIDFPLKGFRSNDDYWSGTSSAVAGGTTTIAVFLPPPMAGKSLVENIREARKTADAEVVADYCFQQTLAEVSDESLGDICALVRQGYPGFKVFLGSDIALKDYDILRVMATLRDCGGQLLVNGGNPGMERFATGALSDDERADLANYGRNRPEIIEAEGLSRAAFLARYVGLPIYAVHLSSALALAEIKKARAAGCKIVAETCPHYLLLSDEKYLAGGYEALKYTLNPPLRDSSNLKALWSGLADGSLDIVASDHCPFNMAGQKDQATGDFLKIPNGLPGIEPRLPLLYSEGVAAHRLSLGRFVEVTSTNPAKYLGLYPRKGEIAAGSDADLVLIETESRSVFSKSTMLQRNDYSPYEGLARSGSIRVTLIRGEMVYEAGRGVVGRKGQGAFLPRFPGERESWEVGL
ncbi:MAG TPA: dihydropyrimidinase [Rectinemataceae bacterium]|nr:dihydropyrimidinase [Rectinemataceae bacterium]